MDTIRKVTQTLTKDGDKAMERIHDVADSAREKGRETWEELRDQGRQALDYAQKNVRDTWDDTEKLVQKHPGKAVGLALMVGVAIGSVLVALQKSA
jgi:ElaB/YqjD/DUF883 family membrane-anchored ribosome-binding protein